MKKNILLARALYFTFALVLCLICLFNTKEASADQKPPRKALKYRADLTRLARVEFGLNAPIALFAAQIHQESYWNPYAKSHVGASGMAQFMPGTSKWWCEMNKISVGMCKPTNPIWAMRAMLGYDHFLLKRVTGLTEYDRFYAVLRAYNGGLNHWYKEKRIARSQHREAIDAACGKARRHWKHCKENLNYPKRIMNIIQPVYVGWGRGVFFLGGSL